MKTSPKDWDIIEIDNISKFHPNWLTINRCHINLNVWLHTVLNVTIEVRFHLLSIFLEPVVQFGWNLKWGTFSKKYLKRNSFQGQKGHIKATWLTFWPLFRNFSENSKSPIQKLPVFEKKSLEKICSKASSL